MAATMLGAIALARPQEAGHGGAGGGDLLASERLPPEEAEELLGRVGSRADALRAKAHVLIDDGGPEAAIDRLMVEAMADRQTAFGAVLLAAVVAAEAGLEDQCTACLGRLPRGEKSSDNEIDLLALTAILMSREQMQLAALEFAEALGAGMRAVAVATRLAWMRAVFAVAEHASPDSRATTRVVEHLAKWRGDARDYAECAALWSWVVDRRTEALGADHPETLTALSCLGRVYERMGAYDRSAEVLEAAVQRWEVAAGPAGRWTLLTYCDLGYSYARTGDWDKAEQHLTRAFDVQVQAFGVSHPDTRLTARRLAKLLTAMGDAERAAAFLQEIIAQLRTPDGGPRPEADYFLWLLGDLYRQSGDLVRARQALSDLVAVRPDSGHGRRAQLSIRQIDWDLAGFPLDEASLRMLWGETHPQRNIWGAAQLLSTLHYADSQPQMAELWEHYAGMLEGSQPDWVTEEGFELVDYRRGRIHATAGDAVRAEAGYQAVLDGQPGTDIGIRAATELALLRVVQDDWAEAWRCIAGAVRWDTAITGRICGFGSERQRHARLLQGRDVQDLAYSVAVAFPGGPAKIGEEALGMALRRKGMVLESLLAERWATASLDDPVLSGHMDTLTKLRHRMVALATGRLTEPHQSTAEQLEFLDERREKLESEIARQSSVFASCQEAQAAGPDAVADLLPDGAALVEYVQFESYDLADFTQVGQPLPAPRSHYLAFVLRSASEGPSVAMVDLGLAGPIEEAAAKVRAMLATATLSMEGSSEAELERLFRGSSRKLYGLLVGPLREALEDVDRLIVSPDGVLRLVPFEALVDEDGNYLVQTHIVSYLASGRDLIRHKALPPTGEGGVVFAAPDYDMIWAAPASGGNGVAGPAEQPPRHLPRGLTVDEWRVLPGMRRDAERIADALRGTDLEPIRTYTGPEASEEAFMAVSRPRFLAISTHGFFLQDHEVGNGGRLWQGAAASDCGNPLLRSGFALAGANHALVTASEAPETSHGMHDGIVTAEEVISLDLCGTELVVLAACDTGLGSVQVGEGVFGLRRAFQIAGAQSLLVSLFSVPDRGTSNMLADFLRRWPAREGDHPLSKADALHQAKLAIIDESLADRGAAHPCLWAGLVLVGDPT